MAILAGAPVPVCCIRVITFNPMDQSMHPVKLRVAFMGLADLVRLLPAFPRIELIGLK